MKVQEIMKRILGTGEGNKTIATGSEMKILTPD